jgi:hypothetical protein
MTQLSRPYQVALAAIGLLAAVWFVALRGHSGTGGAGGGAASPPAPKPTTPSTPYHGSAPGVAGLTRAIEKARGAVTQSEANAKQLERRSAQASSPSSSTTAPASSASGAHATSTPAPRSSTRAHASPRVHTSPRNRTPSKPASAPNKQALVETELKQGSTVIVLFWNPKGTDDIAVRRELHALRASHSNSGLPQDRRIVLHEASAGQVGSFGSYTRAVQVYATPTLLIIMPSGKTRTLTGLTDAYSIQQAISEARRA